MPEIQPELRQSVAAKLQDHRDALTARVAEILNISEESLENAFEQVQGELREKSLDNKLQELVAQGAWTQQQADEYKAWIKATPMTPLATERTVAVESFCARKPFSAPARRLMIFSMALLPVSP